MLHAKHAEAVRVADENRILERSSSQLQSQILEADVKMAEYKARQKELEATTVSAADFQELKEDVEDSEIVRIDLRRQAEGDALPENR